MKKLGFTVLLIYIFSFLTGQSGEKVQVTGLIKNAITKEPVNFVNIIINEKLGTSSDNIGRFSIITKKNDTILFSAVGFKKQIYRVPDTTDEKIIYLDVMMLPDTISIRSVDIYPWATYEDFKMAFLNLRLPDDEIKNAEKNIEIVKNNLRHDQKPDASISYKNAIKNYNEAAFNKGILYPTNSLLNPFAWYRFFQAIKNGDFKQKE
jgi:hypothetical protein